ncbi:SixA phosphatase family protein [Luteimonas abyssi]|uniref:SixA phosphatase family protein n=1 Tax=Luteimonas abyssi TaxID=1247514 RepID=UPI000737BF2A|nr:histidine phosphatase family protein [Luteimonas abyssi]
MRELILLRHAHADAALPGQPDLDRPLSATGHAEAESAARWLLEKRLVPDQVLCSPARRTRETLEVALGVLGYVDQRLESSIYEATPGALALLLERYRDTERVLLVGHNPGLERLAALLHSGQTGDYRGMPPAGVAVLEFEGEGAIEPAAARLTAFWWP